MPTYAATSDELKDREKFWQGIVNRYAQKEGCVLVCFMCFHKALTKPASARSLMRKFTKTQPLLLAISIYIFAMNI